MRQRTQYSAFPARAKALARFGSLCLLAIAALTFSAFAFGATFLAQTEAGTLAPGDYLWKPSVTSGPLSMVVDLTSQRAFVYRDGILIGISTISSGRPGHETPTGTFTVLEKYRFHRSNKYEDAPMPYMQRLTWDGLALHAGHPHGYPASHGCIRMPEGFAAALFKEPTRGMQVVISGHAPSKEEILMAARARANAQCCQADDSTQTGNLPASWSGQGGSNELPNPPCCAPIAGAVPANMSASPECTADREAEADSGAGDANDAPDQPQRDDCESGQGRDYGTSPLPPPPAGGAPFRSRAP